MVSLARVAGVLATAAVAVNAGTWFEGSGDDAYITALDTSFRECTHISDFQNHLQLYILIDEVSTVHIIYASESHSTFLLRHIHGGSRVSGVWALPPRPLALVPPSALLRQRVCDICACIMCLCTLANVHVSKYAAVLKTFLCCVLDQLGCCSG